MGKFEPREIYFESGGICAASVVMFILWKCSRETENFFHNFSLISKLQFNLLGGEVCWKNFNYHIEKTVDSVIARLDFCVIFKYDYKVRSTFLNEVEGVSSKDLLSVAAEITF